MSVNALSHFLAALPETDGAAAIDNAAFEKIVELLETELDSPPQNLNALLSDALQEHGALMKTASQPSGSNLRGLYEKQEIHIKKTSLLGIVATLLVAPVFWASLPSPAGWSQMINWFSALLGLNALQLIGFLQSFASTRELELGLQEEKVHEMLFDFFLPKSLIAERVRARHPELSHDDIDTTLYRMESHGFVVVKEKEGEKWYKLNAKWKAKRF
ncbi:hypothetical protein HUU05_03885 [candidate division KSB1 bacterium]|nr:hypothetical protein [candidate division KSB1 bacterium]